MTMTREQWIERARELLADNDEAAELLAVTFEAPTVIEAEVVVDDELDEPESQAPAAEAEAPAPARARTGLAQRFTLGKVDLKKVATDEGELTATERAELGLRDLGDKAATAAMDALEDLPNRAPTINRDRAFGRFARAK